MKFTSETPCRMKKEVFLGNSANKQKFIFMLGECLMGDGFSVHHANDDADFLIVETAIELAKAETVTVLGEDTDLLVLLLHHYRNELQNYNIQICVKEIQ